jgi:NTP pyrophosphatase (non-canonical NTP hydrolase)
MSYYFNQLKAAEHERLAILSEELGEAQQAIGKILRHGYESVNPTLAPACQFTNREELEHELGDVLFAVSMLSDALDVSHTRIAEFALGKAQKIKPYLHHQGGSHERSYPSRGCGR